MAEPGFNPAVEKVRLEAARGLPPSCLDEFQRLSRSLVYGPAFQWLLVDAPDDGLRKQLMAALDEVLHAAGMRSNRLPLSDKVSDVAMLEKRLLKNAGQADVVHVVGRSGWFSAARWDAFNLRRERLASEAQARLVFWLDADAIALASRGAPDLWAWRGGVYRFEPGGDSFQRPMFARAASASGAGHTPFSPSAEAPDNRSMAQRQARIAEIRNWLATVPAPPDEMLAGPTDELEKLLVSLGDYDAALTHLRSVVLPLYERLGDLRAKAITMGRIADILQARGELDEALRIRQEEELPVFERLDDVREKAVTLGKIANIFYTRGQLDEALRILQQEELPVHEGLGDVRAKAITLGNIADILFARGQFDEALRIRQQEALPVYERLGDLRGKAITMGKIADILQARGQLDEALRIHQQEELPVFERLGDLRAKAVTMGQIADILQASGQLNEALRLYEECLPTFTHLRDADGQAQVKYSIARVRLQRGDHERGGLQAILDDLAEAFEIYQRIGRADAIGAVGNLLAQVLAIAGMFDEGLAVLTAAETAYRTLADAQGLAQVQALRKEFEAARLPDPSKTQ